MKYVFISFLFILHFILTTVTENPTGSETEVTEVQNKPTAPETIIKQTDNVTLPKDIKTNITTKPITETRKNIDEEPNIIIKICNSAKRSIVKIFKSSKVNRVLKNVGTCLVNGIMEIISYYVPAPFIPLIATAASKVIPYEPVVTLRHVMPVASYRRAFNSAVNSFMGTFDKYKMEDDDPYMTRRFNRRFLKQNRKDGEKVDYDDAKNDKDDYVDNDNKDNKDG